jgi:hypothetical protein
VALVFDLSLSQHNSFVLSKDWTELENQGAGLTRLIFTGSNQGGPGAMTLAAFSDNMLTLHLAQFSNKIKLKPEKRQELIALCKNSTVAYNGTAGGKLIDRTDLIERLMVRPISLFEDQNSGTQAAKGV